MRTVALSERLREFSRFKQRCAVGERRKDDLQRAELLRSGAHHRRRSRLPPA
jgi:hypothetical protein